MKLTNSLIAEQLKQLPTSPGVYLMRDGESNILYVGKAASLRHRVRSYFSATKTLSPKPQRMVSRVHDFDFFITASEQETLILELNLIKRHRPRYTVRLKDDKTFPYLKIDTNADWPRVYITRRVEEDGGRYFGPFASARSVRQTLKVIKAVPKSPKTDRIAFLLNNERLDGKGWHIRAIMEIARTLGADLAIVEADLKSRTKDGTVEGLAPDWIRLLLKPIRQDKLDLVVSRFNRHWFESPIAAHIVYPLLTAIYNSPIHDLIGAQWGISHRLLRVYLQNHYSARSTEAMEYGIDIWLATMAITSGARIGEANLGVKIPGLSLGKWELVLRQISTVLFEQIVADKDWWKETERAELPLLQPLPNYGLKTRHKPYEVHVDPQQLIAKYKQGFNRFYSLYKAVLPEEIYEQLARLSKARITAFNFSAKLWAKIVYHFLLAFASSTKDFAKGDIIAAYIPLQEGRIAAFTKEILTTRKKLEPVVGDEAEYFALLKAERQIEEQVNEFVHQKAEFLALWESKEEASKPPLPKVTYRQFIPGVHLVVPLELITPNGKVVTADSVYESVFHRYKQEFEQFIYKRLRVAPNANSQEIANRVSDFMHEVEEGLDKVLLPGDLSTVEGTKEVVAAIFRHFPHRDTFALSPKMASWLLWRHPPYNLITKLGYSNLNELLSDYAPNDALALADWSEEQLYTEQ